MRAEQCRLYHNDNDKANETKFSFLFTLLGIISIRNSSWMYFIYVISIIHFTFLVTSFNLFSHWSAADNFFYEKLQLKLNWEKGLLVWIGKGTFKDPP